VRTTTFVIVVRHPDHTNITAHEADVHVIDARSGDGAQAFAAAILPRAC
jgi:hypothetical protein